MKFKLFSAICLISFIGYLSGQSQNQPYEVKSGLESALSIGGLTATTLLYPSLYKVSEMDANEVAVLDRLDVNRFDRPIIDMDPDGFKLGRERSDMWLNMSTLAPFALLVDKTVRSDWKNYVPLYLETQALNAVIYQATAFSIRRPRPLTYNTDIAPEDRSGEQSNNSFYSGHVSFAAGGTFFMVKTYTDYHEIRGLKRVLLYTAAAIPPSIVGYYRMQAGKHFKTDVIVGFITGAALGILVPELHRKKRKPEERVF